MFSESTKGCGTWVPGGPCSWQVEFELVVVVVVFTCWVVSPKFSN